MVSKRMEKSKTVVLYSVFCFVLFFFRYVGQRRVKLREAAGDRKTMKLLLYRR